MDLHSKLESLVLQLKFLFQEEDFNNPETKLRNPAAMHYVKTEVLDIEFSYLPAKYGCTLF